MSRYADHLPLYRQSPIPARLGIEIGRDSLASWVGVAANELKPVVARLREILLGSSRLFADETTLPVLDPGRGRTKTGYAWAIARDDRPWGGSDPQGVVFRYAPGRGQEHAKALLGGYAGLLQCDGYAGYKSPWLGDGSGPTLAVCWAHVRREFYDLAKGRTAPIATEALRRIAEFYAVGAEVRGKPPDVRRAARQARSKPLVEALFAWLEGQLARLPGGAPTAEKIRYALNHRGGLEGSDERLGHPVALRTFERGGPRQQADVTSEGSCIAGDLAAAVVAEPFDRLRQAVHAAEPLLDGGDHEVAHVITGDAGGGADEAHRLAVAAVEGKGDAAIVPEFGASGVAGQQ